MSLIKVKKVIRKYTCDLLKAYNSSVFTDINTAWINTDENRNGDPERTECWLALTADDSYGFSIDREFYLDEEDVSTADVYKTKQAEIHTITVIFGVTSMSKKGVLTPLEAQNLAYTASSHIRKNLKTLAGSSYFLYDNEVFTPIHILSDEMSNVTDMSEFEETKYRYTFQFSCKFRFDEVGSVITSKAENANVELTGENIDIEFDIEE